MYRKKIIVIPFVSFITRLFILYEDEDSINVWKNMMMYITDANKVSKLYKFNEINKILIFIF